MTDRQWLELLASEMKQEVLEYGYVRISEELSETIIERLRRIAKEGLKD